MSLITSHFMKTLLSIWSLQTLLLGKVLKITQIVSSSLSWEEFYLKFTWLLSSTISKSEKSHTLKVLWIWHFEERLSCRHYRLSSHLLEINRHVDASVFFYLGWKPIFIEVYPYPITQFKYKSFPSIVHSFGHLLIFLLMEKSHFLMQLLHCFLPLVTI